MAVVRGFVQKIDVGRAGLVQVTLVQEDTAIGVYVIRDLDADPERFNERLSKLGVLRDAMNRAEPVEIEFDKGESGDEISRAVRITRDDLTPPKNALQSLHGLVLQVSVNAIQGIQAGGVEQADSAAVLLFNPTSGLSGCVLNLQTPERAVAAEMLRMLLDAEAKTQPVALGVEAQPSGLPRILSVTVNQSDSLSDPKNPATVVSGFVETLSLIQLTGSGMAATFANVQFTTAPDFTGPGNTVSKAPFTPMTLTLLAPKNSLVYELFEAGLRDNLRMRVQTQGLSERGDTANQPGTNENPLVIAHGVATSVNLTAAAAGETPTVFLALAAELLAPLASASRPVWINIDRESLDAGPDCACAEGVPSSDLNAKSLRDLRIPYKAVWKGLGCFNKGVYRIQIETDTPVSLRLDCEKLCLHPSDNPKVKFAYACLCGDHELEVTLCEWTCDKDFNLDVYRIR